jgi:hypothetical protein
VLLKALRAACAQLAGQETPAAPETAAEDTSAVRTSSDLADGLVVVAESFLAGKVAGADDPEIYQVVVHAGVSAETSAAQARVPGNPAAPPQRSDPPRRPGTGPRPVPVPGV